MSRPALLLGLSGAILMVPLVLLEVQSHQPPVATLPAMPAAATHVCVTPDLLCPIPAMQSGSPCGCSAGLHGRIEGHAESVAALLAAAEADDEELEEDH